MRRRPRASWGALATLALLVAGCGTGAGSAASPAASRTASGAQVRVFMKTLEFTPATVHATAGQRIVWRNLDSSPHNVTYVSGPHFTSSRRILRPGAAFSITVTTPGTIHYFCTLHPWMKAAIVVSS